MVELIDDATIGAISVPYLVFCCHLVACSLSAAISMEFYRPSLHIRYNPLGPAPLRRLLPPSLPPFHDIMILALTLTLTAPPADPLEEFQV